MGVYIGHTSKYNCWAKLHICSERRTVRRLLGTPRPSFVRHRPQTSHWSRPLDLSDVDCERQTVRRCTSDELLCPLS